MHGIAAQETVLVNLKTALLAVTAAAALLGAAIIGVPSTLRQDERSRAYAIRRRPIERSPPAPTGAFRA